MTGVDPPVGSPYDLWYDAHTVRGDLVVECWISHGPRAEDPAFDPQAGDWLRVGDDDGAPLGGRVVSRDSDRVAVQIRLRTVDSRLPEVNER